MTKKPSRPEQKPASSTAGGGKAGGSEVEGREAMARFRRMAKQVVGADRKAVEKAEKAAKRKP
jgi:molybdenum-dependent DNA-binding transcriptional regulator ModE